MIRELLEAAFRAGFKDGYREGVHDSWPDVNDAAPWDYEVKDAVDPLMALWEKECGQ